VPPSGGAKEQIMTKKKSPGGRKKQPKGNYPEGYARPPERTRIKPGEVRNPWGRNGKPGADGDDPFEFAMGQKTKVSIDGVTMMVTAEAAIHLKQASRAMGEENGLYKIIVEERRFRRGMGPAPLTPAEIEAAAAEIQQRKELSARLMRLLEDAANRKKRGEPIFLQVEGDGDGVIGD
jgi:hypothetical protein